VADVADDGAGADRPGAEDLGQAGGAGFDRCGEFLADLAQLGIQAADVSQEIRGELAARLANRVRRRDLAEDAAGLGCGDLPADTAGD